MLDATVDKFDRLDQLLALLWRENGARPLTPRRGLIFLAAGGDYHARIDRILHRSQLSFLDLLVSVDGSRLSLKRSHRVSRIAGVWVGEIDHVPRLDRERFVAAGGLD